MDCLKVDDPLSSVGIHLAPGAWGVLSLGIFADGTYHGVKGLITGEVGQLLAQFIIVLAGLAWSLGMGSIVMFALKYTIGISAPIEVEETGLDSYFLSHERYPKGQ